MNTSLYKHITKANAMTLFKITIQKYIATMGIRIMIKRMGMQNNMLHNVNEHNVQCYTTMNICNATYNKPTCAVNAS